MKNCDLPVNLVTSFFHSAIAMYANNFRAMLNCFVEVRVSMATNIS